MAAIDLNMPDEGLIGARKKNKSTGESAIKTRLENRKMQLNQDRMTWWANWSDLGLHFRPYRGRWFMTDASDTNKGWRRNWQIVDSTPLITNNICAAGLLAGTASPSRPWFGYEFDDEQLMEAKGVKEWLAAITKVNRDILAQSNFYNALFECLGEYGVFGVMALGREWPAVSDPSEPDIPHFVSYTIGSYYIANDKQRRVNTFFRDYRWTVNQVVDRFGDRTGGMTPKDDGFWANISLRTRGLWEAKQRDTWIDIVHAIEENIGRNPKALGWQGMRFRSIYYEKGGAPDQVLDEDTESKRILRIGGFRDFPVFCARWYTNSEDSWGRGWAMDALGDARALQLQQKRKAQAIDKLVDPPYIADASLRNQRTSQLAGDTTFIAPDSGSVGFKPAYEIKPDVSALLEDIKETQERIKSLGYADIFAMFIQAEQAAQPITAAEVNAKQQEKLLMLGPVLEQMNFDLFNPLHEWLFAEGMRHGKYPPPPEAIGKATLRIKYTSILAQAVNAITAQNISQFSQFVGTILQMTEQAAQNPTADKVDFDEMIEEYGKAVNVPPHIVRSDADVEAIRTQRQQQQEQQQAQEQAAQAAETANTHADTAQKLSQTPTQGGQNNALDQLAQSVGAGRVQ